MKEEEKYQDFIRQSDTSERGLLGLFIKRYFIRYMRSPFAGDIVVTHYALGNVEIDLPDNKPATYDERAQILEQIDKHDLGKSSRYKPFDEPNDPANGNPVLSAAVRFPLDAELRSARYELATLNPSEIEDPYIAKRVEAYLKVCRGVIERIEQEKKKDITSLHLADLDNRELAAYFFYNKIDVNRKNIRRVLKEHGIDKELKKPEDIVEKLHLWDKWDEVNTRWRYGKNASKSQRQELKQNYLRVRRFLTGPALAILNADYDVFLSYTSKK